MSNLLRINEVATKYGITKRTLRYYDEIGILPSKRSQGSNYRYYDNDLLSKLEQIILLKSLDFQISEISQIILCEDEKLVNNMLKEKLITMQDKIDELSACKKVISSIIKIKKKESAININFYELIKEQIYIHKNIERRTQMDKHINDIITIEFGVDIIPCANELIDNIKEFRQEVANKINKDIPLIRIRDNPNLKNHEYRILIKDIIVKNEFLENHNISEKTEQIILVLKNAINTNLDSISNF